MRLLVFGQSAPRKPEDLGFLEQYLGHFHDDLSLRILCSAADVMVVPSRQEVFGQTASEAHACGTRFRTCGLPDIVSHLVTGYLARPFDTEDLAAGIEWVLADSSRQTIFRATHGVRLLSASARLWLYLSTWLYMKRRFQSRLAQT